ncbi:MAG: hypothetical protein IJ333_02880 [Clostridia bacterium]|nr:hypothetical protein [Clostridia bacterium]
MKSIDVKNKLIGFFCNEWQIKLVSILLALLIWFLICEYVDPETDTPVSNIKITAQYEGSVPEKEGLGIMTTIEETVSIRVSGSRDTIALMDPDKITATLDMSNVTKSGEYDLPVKINLGNQSLKLVSQSLETVKVRFDTNKVANVKVNVEVSGGVAEGFILEEPTMLNNFVKVTGPAAIVDSIASAEVKIEQTMFTETSTLDCEYTFVDQEGNEVLKTFLKIEEDMKTVAVTVAVVKEKTVPLTVNVMNSSGGKDSSFCTVKFEPETITITGNAEVLDAINSIELGDIDVAEKTENFETTVKVVLPNGVKNVNNVESAKVSVSFNDVQTRTFTVTNIRMENLPDGTTAKIAESSAQITVRGISEDIMRLKAEDLQLVVDVRNQVLSSGTTSRMAAYLVFPEDYKIGVIGKYQLTVVVS